MMLVQADLFSRHLVLSHFFFSETKIFSLITGSFFFTGGQ
jgi:hypothetical protein